MNHPIRNRFVWAGIVSLLAWVLLRTVAPGGAIRWTPAMVEAARAMETTLAGVAEYCRENGIPVDQATDPNGTCLIGPEHSELFTSLGQLEAKRTSLAPDMAGLVAHLLREAGVGEGDRVAVGASGSFPGLLVATLAAVNALGAEPVSIISVGASSYGATRPGFHLADIYGIMAAESLAPGTPAAVSLGGSGDVGSEFDPSFREVLLGDLRARGLRVIQVRGLRENVRERLALYGLEPDLGGAEEGDPAIPQASGSSAAGGEPLAAFVNVGGAEVNLGTSFLVLNLPPGLVWPPDDGSEESAERSGSDALTFPPRLERGMIFEMLDRGIPVIHLLHVRGLALRYGLPWDPLPLPRAASTRLKDSQAP